MATAIGKKASRFAKQLKKVQPVLGDHQDAVIADGPVDLPQRHGDVVAAQGPVLRQGVLVVAVDEGAVDVEDDRVRHGCLCCGEDGAVGGQWRSGRLAVLAGLSVWPCGQFAGTPRSLPSRHGGAASPNGRHGDRR
jgi:hypothetical protein